MTSEQHGDWYDESAGPMIRPYAMTRGRTIGACHNLDMLTVVATPHPAREPSRAEPEYWEIVRLCCVPMAIVEVSATLRLPLAVTKILVGDLVAEGALVFRAPVQQAELNDVRLVRSILEGIRKI